MKNILLFLCFLMGFLAPLSIEAQNCPGATRTVTNCKADTPNDAIGVVLKNPHPLYCAGLFEIILLSQNFVLNVAMKHCCHGEWTRSIDYVLLKRAKNAAKKCSL